MRGENSEFWKKTRRAKKKLEDQFLNHPDVSLIDIGYPPQPDTNTEEIVLRIHVRKRWMKEKPEERNAFPNHVDGIRVIVIPGDYQLDTANPGSCED